MIREALKKNILHKQKQSWCASPMIMASLSPTIGQVILGGVFFSPTRDGIISGSHDYKAKSCNSDFVSQAKIVFSKKVLAQLSNYTT